MLITSPVRAQMLRALSDPKVGGFSYDFVTAKFITPGMAGFAVSLRGHEKVIPLGLPMDDIAIALSDYAGKHTALFGLQTPPFLLGGWVDDDLIYLDITRRVFHRDIAMTLAARECQKAVYDISRGESIYLDRKEAA